MGWDLVFYLLAAAVISYALAPKQQVPPPASLEEFDFPQIEEGTPQAVIFGDVWVEDWMVLAYGNLRTTTIQRDEGGKK